MIKKGIQFYFIFIVMYINFVSVTCFFCYSYSYLISTSVQAIAAVFFKYLININKLFKMTDF